jgi:hypothetical protein
MKKRNDFYMSREDLKTETSVPAEFLRWNRQEPKSEKEATELFRRLTAPLKQRGGQVYEQVRLQPPEHTRDWSGAANPVADFVLIWPNWGGEFGSGKDMIIAVEVKRCGYPLVDVAKQASCYKGSAFKPIDCDGLRQVDWGAVFPCEVPGGAVESILHQTGLLQIEPEWSGEFMLIRQGKKRMFYREGRGLFEEWKYGTPLVYKPRKGHARKVKTKEPMK